MPLTEENVPCCNSVGCGGFFIANQTQNFYGGAKGWVALESPTYINVPLVRQFGTKNNYSVSIYVYYNTYYFVEVNF